MTYDMDKAIRESNARYFRREREDDARRLAEYQAECLASWRQTTNSAA